MSLKFIPKCPINNFPALFQIVARHRSGDKPLSESMMAWATNASLSLNELKCHRNTHTIHDMYHWYGKGAILITFASLAAPDIVILITYGAANDETVFKITIFLFQWRNSDTHLTNCVQSTPSSWFKMCWRQRGTKPSVTTTLNCWL